MFTLIPNPTKWANAIKITTDDFQKEKGFADVRIDTGGGDYAMRLQFNGVAWSLNLRGRRFVLTDYRGDNGWAICNERTGDFLQFISEDVAAKNYAVVAGNDANKEVFKGFMHLPRSYYDTQTYGHGMDSITFSGPSQEQFIVVSQLEKEVAEEKTSYIFSFRNGSALTVDETEAGDIILPWGEKKLVLHFDDVVEAHLNNPLLLPLAVVIEIGLKHPDAEEYGCEVYLPETYDKRYSANAPIFKNPVYAIVDYRSSVVEYADAPDDFDAFLRLENGKQLEITRADNGDYQLWDGVKTWEVEYFYEIPHLPDDENYSPVIADRDGALEHPHLNLVSIPEAFDPADFTVKTRPGLALVFRTDEQKYVLANYHFYHGVFDNKVEEAQVTPFGMLWA